jgi:hypothetical protein
LVGRPDYPRAALLAGVAIAAFALSLLVSFRVFRNVADWRLVCTVLLGICAGLQVLTWLGWLSTGGAPGTPMMVAAVVFSACAMGAQTAAAPPYCRMLRMAGVARIGGSGSRPSGRWCWAPWSVRWVCKRSHFSCR